VILRVYYESMIASINSLHDRKMAATPAGSPVIIIGRENLEVEEVLEIVRTKKAEAVERIHKAKGGEVFLVHTEGGDNSKYGILRSL
jgi:hypothetical protein